ncbi:dihydropteroate synthase [Riemerella columbina]|uniref:dihydropteroate synthase n=1 Tax=Riemerella columbina TaxID=103810 RepID=UPI00267089B4|nr:dihydropteroate synthase [Riemerella columbina]WKS94768.1 dihydropteroate synthase [Riemerella columbina]
MKQHYINCNGRLVDLSTPKIMGILNITPDSFSDGGQFNSQKKALQHTEQMLKEGATFIDIGAQSTRPNAQFLSAEEEIKRLGNLISLIKKNFPEALISLDTFYAEVVRFGHQEGIDLVNDVSGGTFDQPMLSAVAHSGLPYILMHSNATYQNMHQKIQYDDIITHLNFYFSETTAYLKTLGIKDLILDPGFGFGKTIENQMQMVEEVGYIGFGEFPILVGISKKSFIYQPLGKSPHYINAEMQALHLKMLQQGVSILRVHDVAEAQNTIQMFNS